MLADAALDAAAETVRRLTGLTFPASRRGALQEALVAAMARARMADLAGYLSRLGTDAALLDDLASAITVGESYFFRVPQQFDVVAEALLDGAARQPADRPLRLWSAGCAAGEEAYSLAILLLQRGLAGRGRILATDISRAALARARRGRYGRWSLRDVPDDLLRTYFLPAGDEFELLPAIRDAVELRYLNLAEDTYPSLATGVWGMDVILCRNVLIYFDAATVTLVVRRLLASLGEGGWLILGPSDPVVDERSQCEVLVTPGGLAYRRLGARRAATSVPDTAPRTWTAPVPQPATPEPPVTTAAAPTAATVLRPDDRHPSDWVLLVRSLAGEGRLAEAGRACASALDRHRDSAELAYLHAMLLLEAGRHQAAAVAARRALYLDRMLVVGHLVLGGALARLGDATGARRAFRNAERLLARASPQDVVPASDGEPAARLLTMVRVQLGLLSEATA